MAEEIDKRLIEKLEEIAGRRDELTTQLHDPAVAGDPARSIDISKQIGRLKRLADPYLEFRRLRDQVDEHRSIIHDASQDAELRDLAAQEIDDLQQQHDAMLEQLKEL
ncbi:MAG: PCRF domain-containing protein, partial [Planctomycetota bacterium]